MTRVLRRLRLGLLLTLAPALAAQNGTDSVLDLTQGAVADAVLAAREDWYRVELLIFVRDDAAAVGAEFWDPLPVLEYPPDYRFLIDPALADQRLEATGAAASRIDARGVQLLTLPEPPPQDIASAVLREPVRPDVQLAEPPSPEADAAQPDSAVPAGEDAAAPDGNAAAGADADAGVPEAPDTPLFALPYTLLPPQQLAFARQARQLEAQGQRVLFHGAWWAPLEEGAGATTLALDRGADPDQASWPRLQGSVSLYRSRYLHTDLLLWVNTDGAYLPEGWSIPAPPLPAPSVRGEYFSGERAELFVAPGSDAAAEPGDPPGPALGEPGAALPPGRAGPPPDAASPADAIPVFDGRAADAADVAAAADAVGAEPQALGPEYPYRHAIVHRQSRRMRSNELHYLDHPVIGAVLKLTPVGDEALPLAGPDQAAWRERHGLPAQRVELPSRDNAAQAQ